MSLREMAFNNPCKYDTVLVPFRGNIASKREQRGGNVNINLHKIRCPEGHLILWRRRELNAEGEAGIPLKNKCFFIPATPQISEYFRSMCNETSLLVDFFIIPAAEFI